MNHASNYVTGLFFGIKPGSGFADALRNLIDQMSVPNIFASDNLITFFKQVGFVRDPAFMSAVQANADTAIEKGIIWRTHIVAWAAQQGLRREGDFVECGCYKGTTAKIVCDYLGFADVPKTFYLYDLFDFDPAVGFRKMPEGEQGLFEKTCERFAPYKNVRVIEGKIPDVLHVESPAKIAFLHIDLNNAPSEIAALEILFDRLVPGGVLILDDYGWTGVYVPQKIAIDAFMTARGYQVAELPTGQGMVLK
jgi:O-methyltransferase